MDIEKAHDLIEITPQEIKSVKRYLGFMNPAINMLCNMNVSNYRTLSEDKLWFPKDKKEFERMLDDFVNIYSAIIKLDSPSRPRLLYRGSSNKESKLTRENSFISTSADNDIAKRFMEYGNSALSTYFVPRSVPVLNVEQFKATFR